MEEWRQLEALALSAPSCRPLRAWAILVLLILPLFSHGVGANASPPGGGENEVTVQETVRMLIAQECTVRRNNEKEIVVQLPQGLSCGGAFALLDPVFRRFQVNDPDRSLLPPPSEVVGNPASASVENKPVTRMVLIEFWAGTAPLSCADGGAPAGASFRYEGPEVVVAVNASQEWSDWLWRSAACLTGQGWEFWAASLAFLASQAPAGVATPGIPWQAILSHLGSEAVPLLVLGAAAPELAPQEANETMERGEVRVQTEEAPDGTTEPPMEVGVTWESEGALGAAATVETAEAVEAPPIEPRPGEARVADPVEPSLPAGDGPPPPSTVAISSAPAPLAGAGFLPGPEGDLRELPSEAGEVPDEEVAVVEEPVSQRAPRSLLPPVGLTAAANLLLILLFALYHRVTEGSSSTRGLRGVLLGHLRAEGPLRMADLALRTGVMRTTVEYHMEILHKSNLVGAVRLGAWTWYHVRGDPRARELGASQAALRNPASREIFGIVAELQEASGRVIAERAARSPSNVHYHLKKLVAAGLLNLSVEGGVMRYSVPRQGDPGRSNFGA